MGNNAGKEAQPSAEEATNPDAAETTTTTTPNGELVPAGAEVDIEQPPAVAEQPAEQPVTVAAGESTTYTTLEENDSEFLNEHPVEDATVEAVISPTENGNSFSSQSLSSSGLSSSVSSLSSSDSDSSSSESSSTTSSSIEESETLVPPVDTQPPEPEESVTAHEPAPLITPQPPVQEPADSDKISMLEESEHSVESHEREKEEGLLCEDKRFDTVMRVVIHGVADINRSTDVGSDVDPFVEVRANQVLLGATQAKQDQTTATIEESFYIKTALEPESIKLRFLLKDQDHMSDDDLLGHGYFDLAEEDNTLNQKVHLKWKGMEIGTVQISVDLQKLVVVN